MTFYIIPNTQKLLSNKMTILENSLWLLLKNIKSGILKYLKGSYQSITKYADTKIVDPHLVLLAPFGANKTQLWKHTHAP